MRISTTGSLVLALCLLQSAACWHGKGHYTVAYIAQSYLAKNNPDALAWANELLRPYTDECGENLYPFVESATWPDKIRDGGWNIMFYHHFISHTWFAEGARKHAYNNNSYANVVFAITDATKLLSSVQEDPYGSSKSIFGKSMSLRNLVHYLGDIHQPLHASERVTPNRPEGDEGGNLFLIDHYHDKAIDNLHFVWDHMFSPLPDDVRTNLNHTQYAFIQTFGDGVMAQHPIESFAAQMAVNNSPDSWALESNQIAREFVYEGLTEGEDLPEEYQKKGFELCRERVAIAGYRLGMLLSQIYVTQATKKPKTEMLQ